MRRMRAARPSAINADRARRHAQAERQRRLQLVADTGKRRARVDRDGFTRRERRQVEGMTDAELLAARVIIEAQDSFWAFRRYLNPDMLCGWWQQEVAAVLQQFFHDWVDGKRPKLLIEAPRQHGKSRQVVEFLAWCIGKRPDMRTIYAAFSDVLGIRANNELQRILSSPRYKAVFPDVGIQLSRVGLKAAGAPMVQTNQSLLQYVRGDGITPTGGSFRNTTVLGAINGEGLDLGVIDDPIKGRKESNSPTVRDTAWNWFSVDFMGCFSNHAGLLVIATRRHLDDPSGRMKKAFKSKLQVVSYPAIAVADESNRKVGDALFPELKPIDFLEIMRGPMPPDDWEATMQQNPRVVGGNIIKGSWLKRYEVLPLLKYRIIYGDTAQKVKLRNDYSVFQCWGLGVDGRLYLVDQIRGKWQAPELKARALSFWAKHKASDEVNMGALTGFRVEDKSSGTGLIQELQAEGGFPISGIERGTDKYTRVQDVLGYLEAGNVWIPARAYFTDAFVNECEAFQSDLKHLHDDQVDPMVDAIKENLAGSGLRRLWENQE